jgi:serine protease
MNVHVTTYQFWLILICTLIPPIHAYGVVPLANTTQTHNRPISHLIVKFADSDQRSPTTIVQQNRTRITQNITGLNIQHKRSLPNGAMLMALPYNMTPEEAAIQVQYLSESDQIAYAEPDAWRRPFLTPNDTLYNSAQWHLQEATSYSGSANLPSAWNITTGDSSIVVAVVDTGSLNHADLDSRFVGGSAITSGRDFVTDTTTANDGDGRDNDPTDPGDKSDGTHCSASPRSSWHGTHVIGTIGAETDNAIGIAGIDWNAKLLTARALGVCGGLLSDTTDAIRWSAGESIDGVTNPNPAKIINLSLGGEGTCTNTEQNAIDAAVSSGAVIVVAAGNENTDVANVSPASCQNVITVAALESNGARASFSNYGEEIDIAAPGVSVWSTLDSGDSNANNDNVYVPYSGTSMATPHVSGVIALMLASNTNLTNGSVNNVPSLIETKLKASARSFPTGTDLDCTTTTCGAGMLDAHQAVLAVSTAPSVNAGIDQSVAHGTTVSLSATASDDAYSGAKTYRWGQTSGASVTLQNANVSSTSFTAPATDETLVFQITVTDDTGLTATDTINITISPPDTTPDAFSFTDQTDVERSTAITSNAITVSGINSAAAISVNNGEYSINNGNFTSTTGTVANGDTVQVRHTSSGSFSTATDTVLTIGGVSDTFTSTTLAIDTTPDAFTFTDQTDVGRSTPITSNAITVSGINSATAISVNNGEYSINNGSFTNTTSTVANGDTVQVRHTSSGSFSTTTDTVLTIGGVSDTFTSTTLAIDTTPDAFTFTDQTDVGRSTSITSNSVTISGINSNAAISVSSGGEYRINNGGFTNTTSTVANGDTVQVRHTSSGSFSTTTDTVLTIGGVSDTFTSTTLPDDAGSADVVSSDGEKITIEAPDMALRDVETKTEDSVNTENKPDDYQVVGEILSYKVKGIADGATVEITLTYPNALGSNSKIYKIDANGFSEFPNAVISGNKVTLTLVDGGSGDADGEANGVIVDPVAVMEPSNSNGESGGGGSIDLLLLIMLLASVLTHYHWARLSQMKTASN